MKKQSNKGSLLGHLLSPITMGFSRSKQRSKQVSQEMLTRRTTTSLNEKSLSINSDGNDTAQDDDDVIVEESRITSIKKFHRTETSEGISCAALSLHTGSFPSCPGGATKNLDDEILVVPLVIESSKKQRLAHQVSALSDVPVEGEQPGVVCSPCSSTGEATSVETLVKSINELWLQDPSLVIGNNDAAQCREVMETLLADKEQLHRILVARKYTINLSTNLFFEQLRFRTRWEPENIGPQDIPNALPSGAWRLCGYTRDGYIVSNYKLRYWDPNAYGISSKSKTGNKNKTYALDQAVNEYVKYVVFMIQLQISRMLPSVPQQFVVLFDLKGFKPSLIFRRDVRIMIQKLIYVAQAQYPERLYKTLLVNAPFGFEAAWKLIHPLLDEKTASKIHFCKTADLLKDIDPAVLSKEYGGTHDEYPIL